MWKNCNYNDWEQMEYNRPSAIIRRGTDEKKKEHTACTGNRSDNVHGSSVSSRSKQRVRQQSVASQEVTQDVTQDVQEVLEQDLLTDVSEQP